MTSPTAADERHVAAVAEQLHDLYCRSFYERDPRWSQFHHDMDREKAAKVVAGLAAAGWLLAEAGVVGGAAVAGLP
jgi:hypothetical protein